MLEETRENGLLIATVTVETLDMAVAAEFQEAFENLIMGLDVMVLLDLSRVIFMDSSGLASFIYCFQLTEIKNELAVCCVGERVSRLFELTRMKEVVRIFDTREEAISVLAGAHADGGRSSDL